MASEVHRTTVSIPLTLKKRMDEVAGEVNWSEVAAEAFERKLQEMIQERQREEKLSRLREFAEILELEVEF